MSTGKKINVCLTILSWCIAANIVDAAPITAASLPAQPCNLGTSTQNQIQGFSFTPTVNLQVTSLGVADCNMNGLNLATPVGLYRGDGALLVDTQIAAGNTATLEGSLRFTDVSPVTLLQGVEYRIFSFMEHDIGEPAILFPDVTYAPQIVVNGFFALQDGGVHTSLPGLTFIGSPFCCSLFGPSFKFETATTVPEPTVLALFGMGLMGLALPLFHRRQWLRRQPSQGRPRSAAELALRKAGLLNASS